MLNVKDGWMSLLGMESDAQRRQTAGKVAAGTMAGIAAGIAAGMLMSPKPGKQLRQDVANAVRGGVENIKTSASDIINNKPNSYSPMNNMQNQNQQQS